MSFDLFIHPIEGTAPLTADMSRALGEVCVKHGGPSAPDGSGYHFALSDGSGVEFFAGGGEAGGMLSLRRWSEAQAAFLFDLLNRTDWLCVVPSGEPLPVLTARDMESAAELVGDADHTVIVVRSPEEVLRAVERAFGQWADYRDQVVKG
ncbi:MAG: hypothetical protein DCF16_12730 [Alphaproteobacteria bacterium]|nr:MAG: hypothetical protein DCF16_12730 [Alphaproteobacteria bacterium]